MALRRVDDWSRPVPERAPRPPTPRDRRLAVVTLAVTAVVVGVLLVVTDAAPWVVGASVTMGVWSLLQVAFLWRTRRLGWRDR